MEDNAIINLFFLRSECAIEELDKKYGALCMSLSMNILFDQEDAKECLNDAYMGVWNTIPPTRPTYLFSYVSRIVRNVSINRFKYNTTKKRNSNYEMCIEELEKNLSSNVRVEDEFESNELSKIIDDFLETQTKLNRILFVRRFWYFDDYGSMAKKTGMNESAIRTRLSRMRSELKSYLKKRGVNV